MPSPAKTSPAQLLQIALTLAAERGPEAVTLTEVAQRAGVKAPSLYKHFVDRAALLKAVEIAIVDDLAARLREAGGGDVPGARIRAMARAYRDFALSSPRSYAAIYSANASTDPELAAACRRSALPLFEALRTAGIPETRVLSLSRTVVAFLHGFVSMEVAGAFRLGGDLEDAFSEGLETLLAEIDAGQVGGSRRNHM